MYPTACFQHTLDLVAHGLRAGLAEMNPHDIGGAAYLSPVQADSFQESEGKAGKPIVWGFPAFVYTLNNEIMHKIANG